MKFIANSAPRTEIAEFVCTAQAQGQTVYANQDEHVALSHGEEIEGDDWQKVNLAEIEEMAETQA